MTSKFILVTLVVLAVTLRWVPTRTTALRCRPCDIKACHPPRTDCPWGTVKDICLCCLVCGKGLNEICGGPWDISGKCGRGLKCVKDGPPSFNARGRCQKIEVE